MMALVGKRDSGMLEMLSGETQKPQVQKPAPGAPGV